MGRLDTSARCRVISGIGNVVTQSSNQSMRKCPCARLIYNHMSAKQVRRESSSSSTYFVLHLTRIMCIATYSDLTMEMDSSVWFKIVLRRTMTHCGVRGRYNVRH